MKIQTTRFGELDLPDESVIHFPEGIIGFKDARRFVLFDCGDEGIFKWMQSAEVPELAFVICEASLILPSYQVMIGEKERELLELEKVEDGVVCLILVIPEDPSQATANLLGPIVMNSETRLGMQLVLVNPDYSTRYPIFADPDEGGEGEEGQHASA
jgi:flagellar assembly factor FliW